MTERQVGMTVKVRRGKVEICGMVWHFVVLLSSVEGSFSPRGITLTPASSAGQALALSHDGRGDKRAFDRLRPNGL